jgi:hypothetical protein
MWLFVMMWIAFFLFQKIVHMLRLFVRLMMDDTKYIGETQRMNHSDCVGRQQPPQEEQEEGIGSFVATDFHHLVDDNVNARDGKDKGY